MADITYTYSDFTFPQTEAVMERLGQALVERMRAKLEETRESGYKTNASYKLSGSIQYIYKQDKQALEIDISLEDYWKYVEYGTRPHWTGVKRLLDWIKIKPVIPEVRNGKLPTVEQLAYMIQRKIAMEGTKPQNFFWNSVDEVTAEFLSDIEAALEKDMDRNIDALLLTLKDIK